LGIEKKEVILNAVNANSKGIRKAIWVNFSPSIGNQRIREKIKNWIGKTHNQERFLNYFNDRAKDSNFVEKELKFNNFRNIPCFIVYFDVALFCNLKNKDVTQFLKSILEEKILKEKKGNELLLLQFNLLEIEKNSLITNKSIEKHFEEEFNDYFSLLKADQFWKGSGDQDRLNVKLMLARVLKQSSLTKWENEKWEEAAFQKYKESFPMKPFSSSGSLASQNLIDAQREWIFEELGPRIKKFRLWKKLRGSEKMPKFIFRQIFSQNHLNILKDYIQNQDAPEGLETILLCDEDLRPLVEQWVEKLNQKFKQLSGGEKEGKLRRFLNFLIILKFSLDL